MNVPMNYDDVLKAKKTHPNLLPAVEKRKTKFVKSVPKKKTEVYLNMVLLYKQVRIPNKKTIIWKSLLVQCRSVLGVDGIRKLPVSLTKLKQTCSVRESKHLVQRLS